MALRELQTLIQKLTVKIVPIGKVKRYWNNPRLNEDAVEAVKKSIEEFGFLQPIVVDKDWVIIVGDTRFLASEKLELTKVPIVVAAHLTPDQVKAYRIADNKVGELAEWDLSKLAVEVGELKVAEFDLSVLAIETGELSELLEAPVTGLTDPDDIPAPPAEPKTKRGDVWILGNHRVMCGDSSSPEDLDRLLDGATIHLVDMDPPYNVKVEPRSNNAVAASKGSKERTHHQNFDEARRPKRAKATHTELRAKDRRLKSDFISDAAFDDLLAKWFANAARVLQPGRQFYIWGGYSNFVNYPAPIKAAGLYFSQAIVWVKEHPVLTRKDFLGNHEWAFYGWREGAAHERLNPDNAMDVWRLSKADQGAVRLDYGVRLERPDGSRLDVMPPDDKRKVRVVKCGDEVVLFSTTEQTDVRTVKKVNPTEMVHLTEKPVELAVRAIRYSSRVGENVLDLFGGSGSTMMGCELTGRNAFLMELDPMYVDVEVQRWEAFTGKKARLVRRKK